MANVRDVEPAPVQARGLSAAEALATLGRCGPNRLAARRELPTAVVWLLRIVSDPMAILLFVAAVAYAAVGDRADAVVLGIALLPIVLVGVVLEGRADTALARLRDLSAPRARVIRDGAETQILADAVVPGDLLVVAEGDPNVNDVVLQRNGRMVWVIALAWEYLTKSESDNLHHVFSDLGYGRIAKLPHGFGIS